ncbi:MAG TPA: 2-dehydropantoate 2-reductase [Burkholderiales bacterium]|nr:2-dehydropantoate 2-reductase [Burkholderiales bacterium]
MRICVFGAGAVGGHLAAKFAAAGHEVSVVARGANLQGIRENGIALREGARTIAGRVRASDRAADLGPQDAVFVTTKATGLAAIADAAAPLAGAARDSQTMFVFVQNGIPWWYAQGLRASRPRPPDLSRLDPGGMLARAIARERVIGAVAYSSNDLVGPGSVVNFSEGRNMLVLGEIDDRQSARIAALRETVNAAGMYSPPATDIRVSVWNKLLLNFGSTLCVPLGEPISALMTDPALRAVRERLLAEGRAIAEAHGVNPGDAPQRPGGAQTVGATAHKPSMLQDYELGRPMEVDAILALPCAFAQAAGVDAPTLQALSAVTARLAARKGLYSPQ